jgi:Mating-type protein MAT alpha 1 HMG-box
MWSDDGMKHIWTLVGNAYTDIRDNHTDSVLLHKFLVTITPQLPIIPANNYLRKMGWQLTTVPNGEVQLVRCASFDRSCLLSEYPQQTNKSVEELVQHCYRSGLVRESSRIHQNNAQVNMVTLPFATTPQTGGPLHPLAAHEATEAAIVSRHGPALKFPLTFRTDAGYYESFHHAYNHSSP